MGLYFIAAGSSSKNREKSLDKCFTVEQLSPYLDNNIVDKLKTWFKDDNRVYVWGANPGRSFDQLNKADTGCFTVDVNNKKVPQVFEYCFYIATRDTKLQEYIGWDEEKPSEEKRPYRYVFFLKNPRKNRNPYIDKKYFEVAFKQGGNQNWLVGQRYFTDTEINNAMQVRGCNNIEDFLGFTNVRTTNSPIYTPPEPRRKKDEACELISTPEWLSAVVKNVENLKKDSGHRERGHESLVEELFVALGYERINDIKHQQGRIDIKICRDGQTLIVIEVKRDWALNQQNYDYIEQAFKYAQRSDIGARYVIVTNGDRYCVYDQDIQGRTYAEKFMGEFCLLQLDLKGIQLLNKLRKDCLPQ